MSAPTATLTRMSEQVSDPVEGFDLAVLGRFAVLAVAALERHRDEIDALNVYPVPDGDTGTNMLLTLTSARDALAALAADVPDGATPRLDRALRAYARGALLGARGNSGVILSQLLGGLGRRMLRTRPGEAAALVFADGMVEATDASYAAVGTPVEGTILTVSRAAADAAVAALAETDDDLRTVVVAAHHAARVALERTPEQLEVLRRAGVVDAGGRGLCEVLAAAVAALSTSPGDTTATMAEAAPSDDAATSAGQPSADPPRDVAAATSAGPAYEVMYLLDADDARVPALRARLAPLGDSLVVVGGEGLWNVHVHVDDVGAAIEAGIEAGRPHRLRVTHFGDQIAHAQPSESSAACSGPDPTTATAATTAATTTTTTARRAVVAVAAGPGLAQVFEQSGAHVVIGGPGRRPSVGMLVDAFVATGAAEVLVLPNDHDSRGVAEQAARAVADEHDVRVVVVDTETQVQGLAALAVHDGDLPMAADVLAMTAASRHTHHGAVTLAAREAWTTAGPCREGDALGVVAGDFAVVGDDLDEVGREVIERLLGAGGELLTLVQGDARPGLARRLADYAEERHPMIDVVVYDGGQERYPVLLGVE